MSVSTRRTPVDVWLVAGSPRTGPYPCMCNGTRGCRRWCPCRGRLDAADMPAVCCARRAIETRERLAG